MHVLLTDRLSCPRCGPEFGLILLADRVEERRVIEGRMGCPNCRDQFPVRGGFADLRSPPRPPLEGDGPGEPPPEEATERLRALLGVVEGPGHLALLGRLAAHGRSLAGLTPDVEVVAVSASLRDAPEEPGVSRMVARPGLPFFSRTFRGVALSGDDGARFLDEAVRVTAPGGRLVVLEAPDTARAHLEAGGLRVLLEDAAEGVVVGVRETR